MANYAIKFLALFATALIYLTGSFWGMGILISAQVQPLVVGVSAIMFQTALMILLGIAIFGREKLNRNPSIKTMYVAFALFVNFVAVGIFNSAIDAGINTDMLVTGILSLLTAYVCFMILVYAPGPVEIPADTR